AVHPVGAVDAFADLKAHVSRLVDDEPEDSHEDDERKNCQHEGEPALRPHTRTVGWRAIPIHIAPARVSRIAHAGMLQTSRPPPRSRATTAPHPDQTCSSSYLTTVPARKAGSPRRRSSKRTGTKPIKKGTIASTSPTMRTIDRPTEGTAPLWRTRSLKSRIPGVCPVVLQKSTKYPPESKLQART